MNILLLSTNVAETPYSVYPLGLSMVAAALEKAGHDTRQIDFLHFGRDVSKIVDAIVDSQPEIIGISIRNIDNVNLLNEQRYIHVVKDLVGQIRRHDNTIPIVLGGSGFSIMPELILEEVGADYGIVGEGEVLMVEFARQAETGLYPEKGCIRSREMLTGDQIPSALYVSELMEFYLKSGQVASLQTKRGCTHRCVYCTYPVLEGHTVRYRSPKAVVDDIEWLKTNFDTNYLFFTDSVFNDEKGHYLDVVREIIDREVSISWTAFFQPRNIDESSVVLMKQAGLRAVEIGADAAADETLKKMGKSFLFKDVSACNDLFARHAVSTAQYYMFGGPGETKETVLEGIENIKSLENTVSFIFMGIRILPGTILEKIALREGMISEDQSLLEPEYYLSSAVDREWLEATLTDAFKDSRNQIFPPDALESSLHYLHKLGYSGPLWDMLLPTGAKKFRRERGTAK